MSKERECGTAIRQIVGERRYDTYVATVTAVDGATCTARRVMDEKEIVEVSLNVNSSDGEGIVIIPKTGSNILITTIDGYKWFASQFSEIEKIVLNFSDKIEINGGGNEGLVKINELTQKLNALVQAFNTHTHNVTAVGSPTGPNLQQAAKFNKSDYENEKITH